MPFAIGENVGPYRIVEKLGQGGMATVFKAYHPALDRYVAIKVLHPAFREDPNFLARFQREARIVAKLDHPNIVPIYDFSEHRGHPYLVMRFIEGQTLKTRLQDGPLGLEEVQRVMEAVGDALAYAHRQGILHRDIKPSNIILAPEGQIYLTDFGLARMAEAGESTLSRDMMVGTPQYISPEQAKGETRLDARTDIYSLGVVLYELLVGRVPFQADTPYAVIHDHIFTPLPLPRDLKPDLPEPLERMLLKALAKDPDDRFQTIEEMMEAFRTALGLTAAAPLPETVVAPPPTVARPAKPARKKRRRWPWVVGGVAVFLCLILLVLSALSERQQQTVSPSDGTRPPAGISSPDSGEALRLLESARAAQEQGSLLRALSLYKQAQEADPQLVETYLEAGALLAKMGEMDRALDAYLQGLAANPDHPLLHQRAAETATLLERWDEAHAQVDWMLREMPEDPLSHAYAGLLLLAEGSPCEEARPELEAALELDPNLPWAHYGLALCHLQEGNREAARGELEFVLGQEETSPPLRARAEQWLAVLEMGVVGIIEREFQALLELAVEIPEEDGLRTTFKDLLDQVEIAWEAGEEERAIQLLQDAHQWVEDHRDVLGDPLADDLAGRLARIIHLATEPPGP
jgi:serine/threonine-protein kinase